MHVSFLALGQGMPSVKIDCNNLATLGDSGDNGVVLDVIRVIGLDVGGQTVECALDGLLGR